MSNQFHYSKALYSISPTHVLKVAFQCLIFLKLLTFLGKPLTYKTKTKNSEQERKKRDNID